jgi:hypothetical protein
MAKLLLMLGTFLILAGSADMAISQSAQGWGDCSMRDIKATTLIEDHGVAADVHAERLFGAALIVFEARKACREGRFSEARALYDFVLTLGPVLGHAAQD